MSIHTTNGQWVPDFVVDQKMNRKVLSIKDIAFAINNGKYSNNQDALWARSNIDRNTFIQRANNEVYI